VLEIGYLFSWFEDGIGSGVHRMITELATSEKIELLQLRIAPVGCIVVFEIHLMRRR